MMDSILLLRETRHILGFILTTQNIVMRHAQHSGINETLTFTFLITCN